MPIRTDLIRPILCRAPLLVLALGPLVSSPAAARDFLVFSTADQVDLNAGDGVCDADASPSVVSCTLRAAVMEANAWPGQDTIRLDPGTYTLSLAPSGVDDASSGDLNIVDDLILEGGVGRIIDGGDVDRVFSIAFASATLRDVEIRNGTSRNGGCIFAGGGAVLLLERVQIFDCESPLSQGGAINQIFGEATLRDVWISGNAARVGGGLWFSGSRLLLERTTVSGNTATLDGGGVYLAAGGSAGDVALVNATVRGNSAGRHGGGVATTIPAFLYSSAVVDNVCSNSLEGGGEGGGIFTTSASFEIANSVLARNLCGPFVLFRSDSDCAASLTLNGYNFVGFPGGCTIAGATPEDLLGSPGPLDPVLGPFGALAGFTPGHVPSSTSPLVDAGDPGGCRADRDGGGPGPAVPLAVDQQGLPRTAAGRCDIGPVETRPIFADGFESGNTDAWSAP